MQTCVLFVDDEPLIRSLYETLSHDLGPDFTIVTAKDGPEALQMLDGRPFEIVVSDLEMPEMPGGELLTRVERKYPDAMRVIVSGHDDELNVARCLTFGHRYLRKPVDPGHLASTLKRLSSLRELLASAKVKAMLARPDSVPAPPEAYIRLSEALQDGETNFSDFAAIIEGDPLLREQLLGVVNSEAFGLSVQVDAIQEIFEVLGVHVVRALILAIHTKEFFEPRTCGSSVFDLFWQHALQVGLAARKIARFERHSYRECQTAYVAGLLHDIGKFVIAAQPDAEPAARGIVDEYGGMSHATIGAYLLGLWGLPESIVTTAELHHSLENVPPQACYPILYVHAAQNILRGEIERLDFRFIEKAGKSGQLAAWQEILRAQS